MTGQRTIEVLMKELQTLKEYSIRLYSYPYVAYYGHGGYACYVNLVHICDIVTRHMKEATEYPDAVSIHEDCMQNRHHTIMRSEYAHAHTCTSSHK